MKENDTQQTTAEAEPSKPAKAEAPPPPADPAEQAKVVSDFVEGLVAAYGLEGDVKTRVDEDDVIYVDVVGEQTEALVGAKGAILQAVLDLLKIVVQRKTHDRARIRLDIAGYAERRREALKIYTQRLADQVKREGGEVMLEPMHPADRKVVHDAVGELDGIRSWSEGEEPRRSVIIGLAPGVSATEDDSAEDVSADDEDDDFETHETPHSARENGDSKLELEVDQAEEGADA